MLLTVHVSCPAKKSEVVAYSEKMMRVRLHANREKGEANEELIKLLSIYFQIPKSQITILKGHTNKIKLIEILSK